MKEYVTLAELKRHLNVDFDSDDEAIRELIEPAQLIIESYLNRPLEELVSDENIDRRVWHATRIIAADYYANRESITFAQSYIIPGHVTALLQPLKRYT